MTDAALIVAIARMVERLAVDVIGGLAVFFGYRLFIGLPTQVDQSGKIELPGFSVTLSRVGPGVFFAAFGTIVLYASFKYPISIDDADGGRFSGALAQTSQPQDLARAAGAIQSLNCLKRTVESSDSKSGSGDFEIGVRDAKIALLKGVWDQSKWGAFDAFRAWAEFGRGSISPSLVEIFRDEGPCEVRGRHK